MAKRSEGQIIGDSGGFFVAYEISRSGEWIANPIINDFGIDVEAVLTEPKEGIKSLLVTNHGLRLQVKTTTTIKDNGDGYISFSSTDLTKEYIMQHKDSIVPVLFAIVQAEKKEELSVKEIYYVDIIKWIERNSEYLNGKRASQNITIKIPKTQTLMHGLKGELKDLVKEKPIRKEKLISDILSSSLTDQEKIEKISLVHTGKVSRSGVKEAIEEVKKAVGNDELLLELVYKLKEKIDVYSNLLNTEELIATWSLVKIEPRLVALILGIFDRLYSSYPYVTNSLKLPDSFNSLGDEKLAYYCALREKYIGVSDFTIFIKLMNNSFDKLLKFNHKIKIPDNNTELLKIVNEYEEYGAFAIYKQIEKTEE